MGKTLVTGGTGFVGAHMVRRLLREKQDLRCLTRPRSDRRNLEGLSVEIIEGDLTDTASLKRAVQGCDTLFHVAADYRLWVRDPEAMERANTLGSRALLASAAEAGVKKVIFTSSVAAVGRPVEYGKTGMGYEALDPTPSQLIGPYKKSKYSSELVAREFAAKGLHVVIVNPSTPIGSHDIKPTPTGKLIVDLLNGKMPGYVDTGLNFVDVEDVAAGHWLASQKGKSGERYILGHVNLSLKEFLTRVARIAGCAAPKWRIPYAIAWMAGAVSTSLAEITGREPHIPLDGVRMSHAPMYYDASKAVRELGLPQSSIDDAIEKAVRWFREKGYVK